MEGFEMEGWVWWLPERLVYELFGLSSLLLRHVYLT